MRYAAIFTLLCASPLAAFECTFTAECYEAESCAETDFSLSVDVDAQKITTSYADLTIVAKKQGDALFTAFATGEGAEYMLSVTPSGARLSSHLNEGPQMANYLGACKGAFE